MDVSHTGVSIHINRATVIIVDNDEVTLSLRSSSSLSSGIVPEDVGGVRVCVELGGSTEKAIEYSIVAQPGTAQGRYGTCRYRRASSNEFVAITWMPHTSHACLIIYL